MNMISTPLLSPEAILYGPRPPFAPPAPEPGNDLLRWYLLPEHHGRMMLKISRALIMEIDDQKRDAAGNALLSRDLECVEKVVKSLQDQGMHETPCRLQSSLARPRSIWRNTQELKAVHEDMVLFAELLGVGRVKFQARHFDLLCL